MARDGIADIAFVNPGYQAGRFPIIAHGEIPFLITNAKGGSKALDAWYREYADEEMGDVKFCMAFLHAPGTFHAKDKLTLPADVAGKNIRPAHATIRRFVSMLGGASVWCRHRKRVDLAEVPDASPSLELALHLRHRQHHHPPSTSRSASDLRLVANKHATRASPTPTGDRRALHQRVGSRWALGRLGDESRTKMPKPTHDV
jgi:hypothetical protein